MREIVEYAGERFFDEPKIRLGVRIHDRFFKDYFKHILFSLGSAKVYKFSDWDTQLFVYDIMIL